MRCNYCDSNFQVCKFKYKAKTYDGKRKQATFKMCLDCQCYGIVSSREKIFKLWREEVIENSIVSVDGIKMYAY